jgi:hypothetical protein
MEQTSYTDNIKGLSQDTSNTGESYSFALNATVEHFSEEQPYPFLSNTPSNFLCHKLQANEIVIGQLSIHEWDKTILAVYNTVTKKKYLIEVSYKNISKGISDTIEEECCDISIIERLPQEKIKQSPICTSKVLIETDCFLWDENYSLKFVYKITDCTLNIYFNNCLDEDRFIYFDYDDEFNLNINEDFLINTGTECNPTYTNLDCDKTRWYPSIDYPCISTTIVSGNKDKGAYTYLIAYCTSGGIPLTSFKSISQPFNIIGENQGIKIKIDNVSKNTRYKYFLLVAVETVKNITTYHKKAVLSVQQTEWIDSDMGGVNISSMELFSQYPFYEKSCDLTISNDILFKSGLSEFDKFNLQPIVNLMELEWVSVVLKEGDYKNPKIAQNYRSLLRDEVYTFGFQPISDNGEELPVFPFIGRAKTTIDSQLVPNPDKLKTNCNTDTLERWKVYNTATLTYKNPQKLSDIYNNCSLGTIYETGNFGYVESTELYPFVPEIWDSSQLGGENLCGKPIRHFKVPDHCITVHHSNADYDGQVYIFPIGVKIKDSTNISNLLDLAVTKGLISQAQRNRIVGYKLVRGNRAGNRSIVAKGLLYDVWKYNRASDKSDNFSNTCDTETKVYYYPNYPYNDLNDDKLIATNNFHYNGKNSTPTLLKFNGSSKSRFTFHSPDTHFTQPDLGDFLKLEAEVSGQAKGYFNISEEHAEYKLLGEKHYNLAKIFGQWMASTITTPTEAALSGTAASIGQSIGGAIPGFSNLGGAIGGLIGGLVGTNIARNSFSNIIYKNSVILSQTEKILNLFKLMGKYKQHHYQHQSIGKYNNISCYNSENKKVTYLETKEYIQEGKLTIQEKTNAINFNNFDRESSVYLKTAESLPNTSTIDNSRVIISENTSMSTEPNPYSNTQGRPNRFQVTATQGRFRIIGTLCNPYKVGNEWITEETLFTNHPDADNQGDFNSTTILRPRFNLDEITDCRYVSLRPAPTRNLTGNHPVIEGDLSITVYEECSGTCTDVVDANITYACKCNVPTIRNISSFYGSIKNNIDNQYGSIYDIEWLDISNCITPIYSVKPINKTNLVKVSATTQYCISSCIPGSNSTTETQYCSNGTTIYRQRTATVTSFADCSVQTTYGPWTIVNNCNCLETSWTNTGVERCNAGVPEIEQISNCGTIRYITGGAGCEVRTNYWNLKLCSDNSNATYQVDNTNLSTGIVIKDNDSGICYKTDTQGALIGPLLTNYYETGGDCNSCLSSPSCGLIQLQVTMQCRNNGMEVTLYPYNSCSTNPNDFSISVTNSSNNGININRVSHNKYVIENNNPTPYTTHTDVTISGFGDSFTYDIWTNTCDNNGCPLNCSDTELGWIQLNTWDGTNISATYQPNNLLPWQTINWYNDNTQIALGTFNFSGTKTGGNYVKLQAIPTIYNSGNCYCHGFNLLFIR